MLNNPRIMLAATGSGAGKTTMTCALLKALSQRGYQVASFKCGPDYIDPMFHQEVLGVPSANLDVFMLGEENCKYLLKENSQGYDLSVIEGVMGFYDGIGSTSKSSSHELAQITETPVVLVVSCKGMGLSIVPLIKGYLEFKPNTIKGILLNHTTEAMYNYYKKMIEEHLTIAVLGYLPHIPECSLESRHLGLITAAEVAQLTEKMAQLGQVAHETIDLEQLVQLAQGVNPLEVQTPSLPKRGKCVRIGIAKDRAFSFYYADNMRLLEKMGVQLVPFSPLMDEQLPEQIEGLILGGGYPEVYAQILAGNEGMKKSIRAALQKGMPCLAECGGFMYLQERLTTLEGESYEMVGYLEGEATMTKRLKRFGYIELEAQTDSLFLKKGEKMRAHEFHYSDSTENGTSFQASKPLSTRGWACIQVKDNVFAGYPHLHFYSQFQFAENFVNQCRAYGTKA